MARFARRYKNSDTDSFQTILRGGVPCLLLPVAIIAAGSHYAQGKPAAAALTSAEKKAFVNRYCLDCHSGAQAAAGFNLAPLDALHPEKSAAQWEKAIVKLRAGMMPPAGSPRPDSGTLDAFATALESGIDTVAARRPNPGAPLLHRLNRR